MNKIRAISFCGIICALCSVIMLASYIPNATFAVPAIAGALIISPIIEVGKKYSVLCYLVVAIFSTVFSEQEAAVLFILFFGYYPILKAVVEKIKNTVVRYAVKLLVFNICAVAIYFVLKYIVLADTEINYSVYYIVGGAVFVNIVFLIYDYGLNGVAAFYCQKVHGSIRKMFKDGRK